MATRASTRFRPECRSVGRVKVTAMAAAAAAAANQFPLRAYLGDPSPLRARMKPMMARR